jgi:hypothetical protein
MRFTATLLLLFFSIFSFAQKPIVLKKVKKKDIEIDGKSIIYGTFIQRLGFSSGSLPQNIILTNLDTKEIFQFRVKPTYKSAKKNTFCVYIKPGNYEITGYFWAQSTVAGATFYTEPTYKGVNCEYFALLAGISSGKIKESELTKYCFKIEKNTINFMGTWNFKSGIALFTSEISKFNGEKKNKYSNIDFTKSIENIPN